VCSEAAGGHLDDIAALAGLNRVHHEVRDDLIDLGPLDVSGPGLTLAAWFNADRFPGELRDPRLISKATGSAGGTGKVPLPAPRVHRNATKAPGCKVR